MNQEPIDYWADVKVFEPLVLEYRLHYNESGTIVQCTMANHPDTTTYIVVDKETYQNYFRYWVDGGKLKLIAQPTGYSVQLTKSTIGFPVVKSHANLLLEYNETYNNIEYYDHRNN
jgi:hypothetical protein